MFVTFFANILETIFTFISRRPNGDGNSDNAGDYLCNQGNNLMKKIFYDTVLVRSNASIGVVSCCNGCIPHIVIRYQSDCYSSMAKLRHGILNDRFLPSNFKKKLLQGY